MSNLICNYCPLMFYRAYPYYIPEFINCMNFTDHIFRDTTNGLLNVSEDPIIAIEDNDEEDLTNDVNDARYLNAFRAPLTDINRIAILLTRSEPYVYNELANYGINKNTANYLFRQIIGFVLDNAGRYPELEIQAINGLLRDFENRYYSILSSFVNIPRAKLMEIIERVIRFTLNNILP